MNSSLNLKIKISQFFVIIFMVSFIRSEDISSIIPEKFKNNIIEKFDDNNKKQKTETLPESKKNIIILPTKSSEEKIINTSLSHFGYDYFFNRKTLSLYDNFPIPDNYHLGPGDEIIIHIWGEIQLQSSYTINREGYLFIDKIGQVSIVGLTILEAKKYLKSRFESVIGTLKDPHATTYFNLTIGRLKSINIQFIGEVETPGIHALHPLSTISTGLIQAGGIKSTGSLRTIQLIRENGDKVKLDFYDFLISGKKMVDTRLHDGDIIFVPIRYSTIEISGEILKPAKFEILESESLRDLIYFSGGLKVTAQETLNLQRIIPLKNRQFEDFAIQNLYIPSHEINFKLFDGDKIVVNKIYDVEQIVTLSGAVKKTGPFPYINGMTILDILEQAGGINDSSFSRTMDLDNVEIIRRDQFNLYPERFTINVNSILRGDISSNIPLKNWDIVMVRNNINYERPDEVIIWGEVNSPGNYPIISNHDTIEKFIERAGGLSEGAFQEGLKVFRNDIPIILEDLSLILLNGDKIIIPKNPSVVQVSGEVYHPGYIQYKDNAKVNYYIEKAGNYNFNADTKHLTIIYPNGNVDITKFMHSPEIIQGCHIIVHKEEEQEKLNITELLKETASILASLMTIIFLINSN